MTILEGIQQKLLNESKNEMYEFQRQSCRNKKKKYFIPVVTPAATAREIPVRLSEENIGRISEICSGRMPEGNLRRLPGGTSDRNPEILLEKCEEKFITNLSNSGGNPRCQKLFQVSKKNLLIESQKITKQNRTR